MGKRCQYPEHGPCATCKEPVFSYTHHSHTIEPRIGRTSTLCGTCTDVIHIAAIPTIKALQNAGIEADPRTLSSMIARGHLGVLIQAEIVGLVERRS